MVVDVLDGDVEPHVRRLLPVVGSHQQGVTGAAFPVQLLGGDQVARLGVDPKTVVGTADDGVRHQSIWALEVERKIGDQFAAVVYFY